MVPVRGISSCILPSLTSGHGEFRDRCCSMAPCFSNEQQLAYFYGHTLSLGKKNKVCLTSLKNMPAASLGSLCPLNRVFYYVGFIFSLKASHEPPCYETKQSVQFTVHGMSIWEAWALYHTHRIGSFCHQTNPRKGSWLDFQNCSTCVAHGAKAQQLLSSPECQTGCVTSWSSCSTGRSTVGLMLAWDRLFHCVGTKNHCALWPNKQLMGKIAAVAQKMWCKLRQSSLQQAQWTPSGYIYGYMCYTLDLHMLTIPIYFFLL